MLSKKQFMRPIIVFVIAIFISANAFGQATDAPNNGDIASQEAYSLAQTDTSHYAGLLEKVKTDGKIRIIVGVKASFIPEGWHRTPEKVAEQRTGIARAQESLLKAVSILNESSIKKYKYIPFVAMEVDEATLQTLMNNQMVNSIEEDRLLKPQLYDTIPLIGANTGEANYYTGYTGKGQTIAILDSGVDKTHPFLSGKVVEEACFSSGGTSLCPNGQTSQIGGGAGVNCSTSISSECAHGTHVAGIAAGKLTQCTDGTYCMRGVAPNANIIAVQVNSNTPSGVLSNFTDLNFALEHIYAIRNSYRIASVNISMGTDKGYTSYCDSIMPSVKASIDQLRSVGIATVIASGNGDSNHNGYINGLSAPACISSAVSVGATNMYLGTEDVTGYSNSASFLSLLAPGGYAGYWGGGGWSCSNYYGIYSSIPGGGWCRASGTSMAAPHVAGAWALMKEKYPSASVDTILSALQSTGKSFTDSRNGITKPRIQVDAALAALPTLPNLTPYKPSGWSDKIVVSTTSGSTTDSSTILTTDTIYVNFTIANNSSSNISTTFYTTLYVDGTVKATVAEASLNANSYVSYTHANIGTLSAGTHTIKIVTDSTGAVTESNESDNEYSKTITVTAATASCTYTLSSMSQSFTSAGGTGSVTVTPSASSCAWTAASSLSWVTITSGNSGTGSGTVSYSVSANTGTSSRTGNITIAGQTFTVTQSGIACTFSISPTNQSFTSSAGTGSVTVTPSGSSCAWTATSSLGWVTITSGSSGTGSGTVSYSVSANTGTSSRTGTITIAGQTFTITQSGIQSNNCAAVLSGNFLLHGPIILYNGQAYWADFQYTQGMDFSLTDAGIVTDTSPYNGCAPSTLSNDFKLHMPVVIYNGISYWADFQYTGGMTFTLTGAGIN